MTNPVGVVVREVCLLTPYDNNRIVLTIVYNPENGQPAKEYTHLVAQI